MNGPRRYEVSGHTIIDLNTGWELTSTSPGLTDREFRELAATWHTGSAPGTIASALDIAGKTAEGDETRGSLDDEDWWARCRFRAPAQEPDTGTMLRLDGLATIADVWLNGTHLLSSSNMHMSHLVEVDRILTEDNELLLRFAALTPLLLQRRPRPRWRTRVVRAQTLRWFRTMIAGRAPGFAPGPAPVGPWRPISLERHRRIAVEAVRLQPQLVGDHGVLTVHVTTRLLGEFLPRRARLVASGPTGEHHADLELRTDQAALLLSAELTIPSAAKWWPATHGTPHLYRIAIEIDDGSADPLVIELGSTGFRTVEAEPSERFGIRINGVPLFCRGASLLPDRLRVDLPHHELERTLILARNAGMNMIRLPGIGSYGSETLYTLCDELGLAVWQDFPFANMDYPIDDEPFEALVRAEIGQFLAGVGQHPSLSVLCGGSEVEQQAAMLGLDPTIGSDRLFAELIPGLLLEHETAVPYVPSTPTGGDLPFRPNSGVAHYFGVGAYRRPLDDARRANVSFAAECLAFANIPEDEALASLSPDGAARLIHHPVWKTGVPRDVGTGWDFDDVRDHYLREIFGVDPVETRWADPDRYLDLSRAVTGEVMAETFGDWRRARSDTKGALVWWLNDILPGAGWGIIDSTGRPKPAYWYLRRALAPTAVWMTDEGTNGVHVHVANDSPHGLHANLEIATFRDAELRVESGSREIELAANTTLEIPAESIIGRFIDIGYAYRFGPPGHDLVTATLLDRQGELLSRAVFFPRGRPLLQAPIQSLGLNATLEQDGLAVRLETNRMAYGVKIEAADHLPDDNWFTLPPGSARTILLVPQTDDAAWQGCTIKALNATGSIRLPKN